MLLKQMEIRKMFKIKFVDILIFTKFGQNILNQCYLQFYLKHFFLSLFLRNVATFKNNGFSHIYIIFRKTKTEQNYRINSATFIVIEVLFLIVLELRVVGIEI